jgi:hypothetical protein
MILASFFVFSFFREWASSQHVASFLLLKNYKINKNFSIELLLVSFRMKELMGQLLVLRAYKLLGTIKYKIVQTTWNNREIRKLRFTYLPPALAFFCFFSSRNDNFLNSRCVCWRLEKTLSSLRTI